MKSAQLALIALTLLAGCNDQNTGTPTSNSDLLGGDENLIGTFEVEPLGMVNFEHTFSEPQWIGFKTNISWDEVDRFKNEEDEFSSVQINQIGTNSFVGSHRGAASVFTPSKEGLNHFEILNRSREHLAVTVYWKPEE